MSDQLVSFSDLRDLFAATPAPAAGDDSAPLPFNLVEKYVKRSPKTATGKPAPAAPAEKPVAFIPVPPSSPAPPPRHVLIASLDLASLPPDDLQTLLALATDAGIVSAGTPTAEATAILADAILPTKKNGEVYLQISCARMAVEYLILRSKGMRTKDAVLAAGMPDWAIVGNMRAHNRPFHALYDAADAAYLTAIGPKVVDSLVEAAVEGDTVRKFKDGEVVSEAHRANVRAQELVLKATDARFRDSDKAAGPSGGVTYNIGAINVAALPPAGAAPALPAAGPAPETIEIGADSCGFSADRPSAPVGNHA